MVYKYEKVNKELLVPQIEDQLIIHIQQEQINIGSKLPSEYKLAEIFGVGRSTIREAVKSLVTKGILEVKRGSGDLIEIDIKERVIAIVGIKGERRTPAEIDDILAKRKAEWKGFQSKYKKGLLKLYAQHAVSSIKGAYME